MDNKLIINKLNSSTGKLASNDPILTILDLDNQTAIMKGLQGLTKVKNPKALFHVKYKLLDLVTSIFIKSRQSTDLSNAQTRGKIQEMDHVCISILEDIYSTDYLNNEVSFKRLGFTDG